MTVRWRILGVIVVAAAVKLICADALPIVEDEAYYSWWSTHLQWGYLDHPPMVAWLSSWADYPVSPFKLRLADIGLAVVGMFCFTNLARKIELAPKLLTVESATLLFGLSAAGLILGVLHTPDVGVNVCWIIVLHEAAVALLGKPKRWLTAGLFTGLGLLSKYTMVLMLPVLLLGLLFGNRKQLQTKWPYLGLATAFLVFVPHLGWNATHDWLTMRFQLKRGFTQSHLEVNQSVPWQLVPAPENSLEAHVGTYFYDSDQEPVERPKRTGWPKFQRNASGYLGSLLALWGLMLIPLLGVLIGAWRRRRNLQLNVEPKLRALLWASALLPVIFFMVVTPFSKVEANWASFYLVGAALLIAPLVSARFILALRIAAVADIALLLGLVAVYVLPQQLTHINVARIERETNGYQELADEVVKAAKGSASAVLFDTYQTGAMLHHYAPQLGLAQYPGLARSSQFLFEPTYAPMQSSGLVVVQHNRTPLAVNGYVFEQSTEVRSCAGRSIASWTYAPQQTYSNRCADGTLRRWFVNTYSQQKG